MTVQTSYIIFRVYLNRYEFLKSAREYTSNIMSEDTFRNTQLIVSHHYSIMINGQIYNILLVQLVTLVYQNLSVFIVKTSFINYYVTHLKMYYNHIKWDDSLF